MTATKLFIYTLCGLLFVNATINRPLGPYLYNSAGLPVFPFATDGLTK